MPAPSLACRSMAEPFRRSAARHPDRAAIVFRDRTLTYAEVEQQVDRIAHVLLDLGVAPGDKVAYQLANCPELVELYYAIQTIGAVAVPLNARAIAREVAYLAGAADASVLVLSDRTADRLEPELGRLRCVRTFLTTGAARSWCRSLPGLAAAAPTTPPAPFVDPDAVSRLQFTGGSTGTPKGVARTHRADLVEIEGTYLSNRLVDDERKVVLIQCPMEHHGGHDWFCMALAVGATLVVCAEFDARAILGQIERYGVSYLILLPPTTCARLMREPTIGGFDLSSVRLVQSSAGGTSPEIVLDVYRHFPNAVLNYGWGQTESGLGSSLVLTREMVRAGLPRAASVGTPMPFIEMRVVDDEGRPVPDGTTGECVVRSAAVMAGYYRQPELTRAAFTADGWLRTGDLMVRDADGYFYLRSRRRELVKSGGENVFVGEVEDVVRRHPAVADCAVFGVPDQRLGEAVAVAVELRPGATLTLDELQRFCRASLASYKKPLHLEVLASLDRDFSGKVDKRRVARAFEVARAVRTSRRARPATDGLVEQVAADPDVFAIALPNGGVEPFTSCYLVRSDDRSLLVDAGVAREGNLGLLARALDVLGVAREDLDVVVTHEHADHCGLARAILDDSGRLLAGAAAVAHLRRQRDGSALRATIRRLVAEGFAAADVDAFEALALRAAPTALLDAPLCQVRDGDRLKAGRHELEVVATPGHTPGHVCLYQPDRKILFGGDLLLHHVSTPICFAPDGDDETGTTGTTGAAGDHLASLRRVAALPVDVFLPAHGPRGGDVRRRARDQVRHHESRLRRLAALVGRRDGAAGSDLVDGLGWRTPAPRWADNPVALRWLTAGQTLAYLDRLVRAGTLVRATDDSGRHHYHLTHDENG